VAELVLRGRKVQRRGALEHLPGVSVRAHPWNQRTERRGEKECDSPLPRLPLRQERLQQRRRDGRREFAYVDGVVSVIVFCLFFGRREDPPILPSSQKHEIEKKRTQQNQRKDIRGLRALQRRARRRLVEVRQRRRGVGLCVASVPLL
jgi:hypothetical protein